ncbi:MAG TPA: DUF899 family protein [Candidatus Kapabacteria bacterium]|nr:DUF899 family protein [Candidatus Kapabacteria bacterium]
MGQHSLYRKPEIEQLFQEIQAKRNQSIELLKQNPEQIEKPYSFIDWSNNRVPLAELFGDKDDLIVIHNMGKGCTYCTLWADEINGIRGHLSDRAALVVINPNPVAVQKEFALSRGWKFRMLSDADMDFTYDMGFALEKDGKRYAQPGFSTFHRDASGTITRIGYDEFGPGDQYSSVWHFFDLLKDGANEWEPEYSYEIQTA